jgi:hypothetical protein
METKVLKGQLFVAMRKDHAKRGFIIRVGYSKRDLKHWLSCYRHEGFRKCHVHPIKVTNKTTKHVTLEQARELLLVSIAQRLELQQVKVFQLGESEYSYKVMSKKPITEMLGSYKGEFVLDPAPITPEDKPEEKPAGRTCCVM